MAKIACCYNCAFAFLDQEHTLECYEAGLLNWPACANHPESYGRMRRTPPPGMCPNYRPKLPTPEGESVKQIPLGGGYYTYVDATDYEWLSRWKWHLQNGYAVRREKNKLVFMHREIMQPPPGMVVDHKSHNKLDNTRDSLLVCTQQENCFNRSKRNGSCSRFHGVTYSKSMHKWVARITFQGRRFHLGGFVKEGEAARAYDRAAVELLGEFARVNFPEEWPPERRTEVYAQRDAAEKERGKSEKAKAKSKKTEAGRRRTEGRRQRTAKGRNRRSRVETPGRGGPKRKTKSERATGHRSRDTSAKRAARRATKQSKARRKTHDAKRVKPSSRKTHDAKRRTRVEGTH